MLERGITKCYGNKGREYLILFEIIRTSLIRTPTSESLMNTHMLNVSDKEKAGKTKMIRARHHGL